MRPRDKTKHKKKTAQQQCIYILLHGTILGGSASHRRMCMSTTLSRQGRRGSTDGTVGDTGHHTPWIGFYIYRSIFYFSCLRNREGANVPTPNDTFSESSRRDRYFQTKSVRGVWCGVASHVTDGTVLEPFEGSTFSSTQHVLEYTSK